MKRSLIVRPEAEKDLAEAYEWYEAQVQGLGSDFLLHVEAALSSLQGLLNGILLFIKTFIGAWSAVSPTASFIWPIRRGLLFWASFMPGEILALGRIESKIKPVLSAVVFSNRPGMRQ